MHTNNPEQAGEGALHGAPPPPPADDPVAEVMPVDPAVLQAGLARIRLRRKLFFGTVIAYMPAMWAVSKVSPTFRSMAIAFGVWVTFLFFTALYSALARCPRCKQYFHMNGMSLLYFRRCLHCQLHVTADRAGTTLSK